jgi:hypothetical protein
MARYAREKEARREAMRANFGPGNYYCRQQVNRKGWGYYLAIDAEAQS